MRTRKQSLGDKNLIGANVEKILKSKNITQKDLIAQLQINGLDITASGLSKLEGQIRCATDIELVCLSKVLHVTVESLLSAPK